MKPAPFRLHRPASVEEAVTVLSTVARRAGWSSPAVKAMPMMALRVVYPPRSSTSTLSPDWTASLPMVDTCRSVRPCATCFPSPADRKSARQASRRRIAAYCSLSDPLARDVLRQPCACRSGVRMVSCRRHAWRRRRPGQGERTSPDFTGRGVPARCHDHRARAE